MKRRNQANHKEEKFRESKYLWYELREKPKPQTRPLIRIIAEITISSHTCNHPSSFFLFFLTNSQSAFLCLIGSLPLSSSNSTFCVFQNLSFVFDLPPPAFFFSLILFCF